MALRDQKKDLDVLQKLGLKYGDTLPARQLFQLLYERIPSTRDICGYGDGQTRKSDTAWVYSDGQAETRLWKQPPQRPRHHFRAAQWPCFPPEADGVPDPL